MAIPYKVLVPTEKLACFTLDLEEDYGGSTTNLHYGGLEVFPEVIAQFESWKAPLTMFVAGNLLERRGKDLEAFRSQEFHSHGYHHPPHARARQAETRRDNIRSGLRVFREFFSRPTFGYRAPFGMLKENDMPTLSQEGVRFDSSFFPGAHVSGVHLFRSSRPRRYPELDLVEIPISPLAIFRMPYSLSYMHITGFGLFKSMGKLFGVPNPLIFDFHLHDLLHTEATREFSWIARRMYPPKNLNVSLRLLSAMIEFLREEGYRFTTMKPLYEHLSGENHDG